MERERTSDTERRTGESSGWREEGRAPSGSREQCGFGEFMTGEGLREVRKPGTGQGKVCNSSMGHRVL